MFGYVIRRMVSAIIVMAMVGAFVFLLLRLAPGDPATILAGDNATPQQITEIRQRLGLDKPLPLQFVQWAGQIVRGDFGESIASGQPVMKLIAQRAEPTASLALLTICVAVILAVSAGIIAAARRGTWLDQIIMFFSVVGFSMPSFVVGYLLIYVFSMQLQWLPIQGYTPLSSGVVPWIKSLILPTASLGLVYVALIARITRASMIETLAEDYIRTAKAKGAAESSILLGHALRNVGVPVVTVIGTGFALLIGGVVVTETVFNIPGIGRLVVDSIAQRDYPIVQGTILLFSGVYVMLNMLIDVSYGFLDPRIRR
ncbi:ABC transporter permease [Gemmobacter fulvus]|uniref:ABC transporter permease n=1 Tax=Gemmobacter fulvus TaxID=2840474 RepID=UPI002796A43D|nr:ABC transporter permease [Gemmobacter fulvus]MDQ1850600.1 ABC transporter permease [Gemmobacter fulvus]